MAQLQLQLNEENDTNFILATSDREEAMRCLKSGDAYGALWDIMQMFRTYLKYPDEKQKFDDKTIEAMRDRVQEILEHHSISFEDCYT